MFFGVLLFAASCVHLRNYKHYKIAFHKTLEVYTEIYNSALQLEGQPSKFSYNTS